MVQGQFGKHPRRHVGGVFKELGSFGTVGGIITWNVNGRCEEGGVGCKAQEGTGLQKEPKTKKTKKQRISGYSALK